MKLLIDKIVDIEGNPVTGLSPTVVFFAYLYSELVIIAPVIHELGTLGVYIADNVNIIDKAIMVVDAGVGPDVAQRYSTYQVSPEVEIFSSYIFYEDHLHLCAALVINSEAVVLDSNSLKVYDSEGNLLDAKVGVNNGQNYYNFTGTSHLVANDNSRLELVLTKSGKEFKKNISLPTQLIRM